MKLKSLITAAGPAILMGWMTTAMATIPSNYNSLTSQERQDALWNEINATAYPLNALPTAGFSPTDLFNPSYLAVTFNHQSDFLPQGRKKLIHTFGSAVKVRWVPTLTPQHRYTGVFREGGIGMLRLSLASLGRPYTPGMGLKIFVANSLSSNVMVMPGLDGQGDDPNPFRNPHNSHLTPPRSLPLRILGGFFEAALKYVPGRPASALEFPLDEFAAFDPQTGRYLPGWVAPADLRLIGVSQAVQAYDNLPARDDLRLNLARLGAMLGNGRLFIIQARATAQSAWENVGSLEMDSPFVASKFGDEGLFFQHPRRVVSQ